MAALGALVFVNAAAWMQARAMTHFSVAGVRTKKPEELSTWQAARALLVGVTIPRPSNIASPASRGLPFSVHRIQSATGKTIETWFVPGRPDRPLVALFHGYAGSKSALLPAAGAIHALGSSTLLVDFHGSGGSSGSDTALGYREADDVAAVVAYARRTWPSRPIVLYGFSMGGAAILRAIAVHDVRPDGIILEATFDRLLETAKNRFRSMGLPATPLAELLLFWGGWQWDFDAFAMNPVDYAAAVRCPTLLLFGGSDLRVTPQQAQALHEAMPEARYVVVPGMPHAMSAVAQPATWNAEVMVLLRQVSDAARDPEVVQH